MIEIKVNDFIEFKEYLTFYYKDKIKNYSLVIKFLNSISLDEMEEGINDLRLRKKSYDCVVLSFEDREEQEVISLYDEYLKYINLV